MKHTPAPPPRQGRAPWGAWRPSAPPGLPTPRIYDVRTLPPGTPVVIIARESCRSQRQHLPGQARSLRRLAFERDCHVVGTIALEANACDPAWLVPAVALAQQHSGAILAESVTRLMRPAGYYPTPGTNERFCDASATLTPSDLHHLAQVLDGIAVYVVAPPGQARSAETRRGITARGDDDLSRDKLRMRYRPVARRMHRQGRSLSAIVREIELQSGLHFSRETIRHWIRG